MTVNNTTATLNEPLQIYLHDRGIILRIKILKYKYTHGKVEEIDFLAESSMVSARAILLSPDGKRIGCDRQPFEDDCVMITIPHEWTDENTEAGKYKLQIQLYGEDYVAERVTLPPVDFIVAEPICPVAEEGVNAPIGANMGFLDNDYIVEGIDDEDDGSLPYGVYDKTTWYPGDVLTAEELNKSEKAIEYLVRTQKAKAIYYPEINADGILSWTNDLDLENPDPVSIIGPEGPVGPQGEQGPKGDAGTSIKIIGQVTTAMELQQYLPTAQAGDSYLVTLTGEVWAYADTGEFINLGAIQGPQGEKGDKGDRGDNLKYSDLTDEEVQELREGFVSYESLVASKSLVRIEIVTQYPTNEEEGVLYIRVEE